MIKQVVTFAFACLLLTSCSEKRSQPQSVSPNILDVDNVLLSAPSYVNQVVTIEGVCTHNCKHGSTKIFLMGTDDSQILRCEASGQIRSFDRQCAHHVVRVTGTIIETRLDEAYLDNWLHNYQDLMIEQNLAEDVALEEIGEEAMERINSSAGCATEALSRHEVGQTVPEKIENFRHQIHVRDSIEGKKYLSFYHLATSNYQILK